MVAKALETQVGCRMTLETYILPRLGQIATITRGQLAGLQGIVIGQRDTRLLLQPFDCADGVHVLVDSTSCEAAVEGNEAYAAR